MEKEYLIRTQLIYIKERESNMCLGYVDLVKKGLGRAVFIGYKVFRIPKCDVKPYDLYFQYQYYGNTKRVPFGKWLIAKQVLIWGSNKFYTTGFHVYKHRQDAMAIALTNEKVIKVKYKGVLAEGKEVRREVIVASRIMVSRQRRSV